MIRETQIDPWAPDFTGQNFWHIFCQKDQSGSDFPWRSIAHELLPVLNDEDCFGRTPLFFLCSNPRADLEILKWQLKNGKSLSITANERSPRLSGLSCLHAAIACLQPRSQEYKLGVIDVELSEIQAQTKRSYWKNSGPIYNEKDRDNQKKRIELLIQHGADLFAVSESYGTPTDLARFTGNFNMWISSLEACGLDPKMILAADKEVERSKLFAVTKNLALEQNVEISNIRQRFRDIFEVLDDFQLSGGIPNLKHGSRNIFPIVPLLLKMGSFEEILQLLQDSISRAFFDDHKDPYSQPIVTINGELLGGLYHDHFFSGHMSYEQRIDVTFYEEISRYLSIVAAVAAGRTDIEWQEWRSHYHLFSIIKAIASFHVDKAMRFPRWEYDWRYDECEEGANLPGSWPADI